jgi:HNH endonuclease
MPKDTPSMAKNKIGRCLKAILDPHPSGEDINKLWEHFDSSCAYCGTRIDRKSRQGHRDHAVPAALGGTNAIRSFVLACARCNGDEKREEPWELFLTKKCPSVEVLESRRRQIRDWISPLNVALMLSDSETEARAKEIIDTALASFDKSVGDMRRLRRRA